MALRDGRCHLQMETFVFSCLAMTFMSVVSGNTPNYFKFRDLQPQAELLANLMNFPEESDCDGLKSLNAGWLRRTDDRGWEAESVLSSFFCKISSIREIIQAIRLSGDAASYAFFLSCEYKTEHLSEKKNVPPVERW